MTSRERSCLRCPGKYPDHSREFTGGELSSQKSENFPEFFGFSLPPVSIKKYLLSPQWAIIPHGGKETYLLECLECAFIYDPEKGDPKEGIPPGTPFEDLPDSWRCPECKVIKGKKGLFVERKA